MIEVIRSALVISGYVLIVVGVAQMHLPTAFIVAGVPLFTGGLLGMIQGRDDK